MVSVLFTFYIQGVLKLKNNNSGAKRLRKDGVLETERSTRSQSVENSLWKRLWTCSKTDYRVNEGGSFLILY